MNALAARTLPTEHAFLPLSCNSLLFQLYFGNVFSVSQGPALVSPPPGSLPSSQSETKFLLCPHCPLCFPILDTSQQSVLSAAFSFMPGPRAHLNSLKGLTLLWWRAHSFFLIESLTGHMAIHNKDFISQLSLQQMWLCDQVVTNRICVTG